VNSQLTRQLTQGERVLLTTMVPISIPQSELEQVFNQISQSLRSSPEGSSLSNDDVATISLSAMEHKFTTGSSVSSSLQKAMADRNLAGGSGSDSD
jgi:hypothetical protein